MEGRTQKRVKRKIKWIEFKIECLEFLLLNGGGESFRMIDMIPLLIFFPLLILVFEFPQVKHHAIYQLLLFGIWVFIMIKSTKYLKNYLQSHVEKLNQQLENLQKQINN